MPTAKSDKTEKRSTTSVVSRQYFQGKDPSTELSTKNEDLAVRTFITEPAKVHVMQGLTLNLGNYESARLDISITVPCYKEEIDEAYTYAQKWIEDRLGSEVKSVRESKPNLF